MHVIKDFCFSSNFDESWSHCSTHQYYNLTNFHQNLMKNEKYLLIAIFATVRFFLYQSLYAINHSLLPVFFVIFENIMSFSQRRIAARFTVWSIKNSMRVARRSTYSRSMKGDQGEHWRNECQWMKNENSWGDPTLSRAKGKKAGFCIVLRVKKILFWQIYWPNEYAYLVKKMF